MINNIVEFGITNISSYLFLTEPVSSEFLTIRTVIFLITSYLYGAIPFHLISTYVFNRQKVDELKSRPFSVTYTFKISGRKAGSLTVLGDITKAIFPLSLAYFFYEAELIASLTFVFAGLIGAYYSVFLKGSGGLGFTVYIWSLLLLSPFSFLAFVAMGPIIMIFKKDLFFITLVTYGLTPVWIYLIERDIIFSIYGVLVALLLISKIKLLSQELKGTSFKKIVE
ncbi:MAG: glycerol-3-phosphate acyltransferase [Dehalococcoidia bacterium]|nr:MAG: glycerol-3-phosphate acyltransferase [Dehalococcoidia bacterium]